MKDKKGLRIVLIVIALIALCACAWCAWYLIQYYDGKAFGETLDKYIDKVEIEQGVKTVDIPVDFEALQEMNPDIYAWIDIPDTDISYPILQREGDNSYYLRRNESGSYYSGGCIFTEDYNKRDFSDRMTVVYGHNLSSGKAFAYLNDYADSEVFNSHRCIYIYLPDRLLVYEVFATYPYSSEHLLLNHDFDNREEFDEFFDEAFASLSPKANFVEDGKPDFDTDKVLTLSTCFRENRHQRFLVQAKLVEEIPAAT